MGWQETKHGIVGFWTEAVQPGNRFPSHSFTQLLCMWVGLVMWCFQALSHWNIVETHHMQSLTTPEDRFACWFPGWLHEDSKTFIILDPGMTVESRIPSFSAVTWLLLGWETLSDCVNPKTPGFLCYTSNVSLLSEVVWCHKSKRNSIALAQ